MIQAYCDFCGNPIDVDRRTKRVDVWTHNVDGLGSKDCCDRCNDLLSTMYMKCARRYYDDRTAVRKDDADSE